MRTTFWALALLMLVYGASSSVQAQTTLTMTECLKNVSLYSDYEKQGNLKDALPFWEKAMCCCPDSLQEQYKNSYINLYIKGLRLMKYQIDNAENDDQRERRIDSLLWLYDQRISFSQSQKKASLWRKASDMARYRPKEAKQILDLCVETMEMLGDETEGATTLLAMQQAVLLYTESQQDGEKTMDSEKVMELYMELTQILDNQAKKGKDVVAVRETLDELFLSSGVANCENLVALYSPKFKQNPDDVEMLSKLVSLLSANQCTQDNLYFNAKEALFKLRPSSTEAASIAQMFKQQGNYAKVEEYYSKAIEMEEDNEKKSLFYSELGGVKNRDLNKPQEARSDAKKALELNPKNGAAYFLLAEIYAAEKGCGANDFENRTVFWVVVDCYEKAKQVDPNLAEIANKYIATYKQYFPSKEDIFFHNYEAGQSYTIPCWIGEKTTIRPRN